MKVNHAAIIDMPWWSSPMHPVCAFKTSPCVPGPRAHVFQHVRGAGTHGDVLDGHTPHTTPHHKTRQNTTQHDTPQDTTTTRPQQHTETETDRDRQNKRRRDERRQDERQEKRRDERRQEKRRDKMNENRRERDTIVVVWFFLFFVQNYQTLQ